MKTELIFTDEEIDRIAERVANKLNKSNKHVEKEIKIYEDCDHDWHNQGTLIGTKTKYQMYICHKCREECVYKTRLTDGKVFIYND